MRCAAQYRVCHDESTEDVLVIADVGHEHGYPTVTNCVEAVVAALYDDGLLPEGRRLHYYDSAGRKDEIVLTRVGVPRTPVILGFAPVEG